VSARAVGVDQKTYDEYTDLLVKLDANEQLVGVFGTGEPCLIVADILYGLLDNGIIKGYVFSPLTRSRWFKTLITGLPKYRTPQWPTDSSGDNWYLFVVHH
jgi:hypothetical protein